MSTKLIPSSARVHDHVHHAFLAVHLRMLDPRSFNGWTAYLFLGKMLISTRLVLMSMDWHWLQLTIVDNSYNDYQAGLPSCSILVDEPTELCFKNLVHWDIDALSTDFATWMAADNTQPAATSRVGILSSIEFQSLLYCYLDEDLCINLRLLVKTSSLLYSREGSPHHAYDHEQLHLIRSSVGAKVLKNLEVALRNTVLAKVSKDKLKGLFLAIFGVIVATAYTTTASFEEARFELLRIPVHHMIVVGERIGLLHCNVTKQRLAENCQNMWNKTGTFEWNFGAFSELKATDKGMFIGQNHRHVGLSLKAGPDGTTFSDEALPRTEEERTRNNGMLIPLRETRGLSTCCEN